jgi:uncharacterized phiE125 gp8 family phage protein
MTLSQVKAFLRIDNSDEDDVLSMMIISARQLAEEYTQRSLIPRLGN